MHATHAVHGSPHARHGFTTNPTGTQPSSQEDEKVNMNARSRYTAQDLGAIQLVHEIRKLLAPLSGDNDIGVEVVLTPLEQDLMDAANAMGRFKGKDLASRRHAANQALNEASVLLQGILGVSVRGVLSLAMIEVGRQNSIPGLAIAA